MIVIGLSGGLDLVHDRLIVDHPSIMHDSAAVLLEDGKIKFAIEEERLNRIKHTNKFPYQSLQLCLESHGIGINEVDLIAYYTNNKNLDSMFRKRYIHDQKVLAFHDASQYFQLLFKKLFNHQIDSNKFSFIGHHDAHAASAFYLSGYKDALVITFDGCGENNSGGVWQGEMQNLNIMNEFPLSKSLGWFYQKIVKYLGYNLFDEYKVMGLAPYGDPKNFSYLFNHFYTLLPDGEYQLHFNKILSLYNFEPPRKNNNPITQYHKDIAASLQEALEKIVFHVLLHYKRKTNNKNLCLAGGVAHNCTLNGKILSSGLFDSIFVQPAAHDAGCALGAALIGYYLLKPDSPRSIEGMEHIYWGTDIGDSNTISSYLNKWSDFVNYHKSEDIYEETAQLLVTGNVVGWVQGRSEFGPRALGNRSILADPRPVNNKDRINLMVKKRESYRPFAPSVLEEEASHYFDIPDKQSRLQYMNYVVSVKEEYRDTLGAITHVDGSARIQTVSKNTNEKFWQLIDAFKRKTGIPVLLNTSFNNNVEPIIDSLQDAIICYMTTGLDYLIVGEYIVKKKAEPYKSLFKLRLSLPDWVTLHKVKQKNADGSFSIHHSIRNTFDVEYNYEIEANAYKLLLYADGEKSINEIYNNICHIVDEPDELIGNVIDLWSQRLIILRP